MTPSTCIARILGPVLVIVGIGLLRYLSHHGGRVPAQLGARLFVRRDHARPRHCFNVHHLRVRDWRVLVTIFGWLFVIGGIFRLLAMSVVQRAGESLMAHHRWPIAGAIVTLALGAFLTAMGYQETFGAVASIRTIARPRQGARAQRRAAASVRGARRARLAPRIEPEGDSE